MKSARVASVRELLWRHVVLPSTAPVSMVALYFTPVDVFGCMQRGLLALAVGLMATVAALVTTVVGVRARAAHDPRHQWWMLTTLILLFSVALLAGLA